jgi:hypothetical protein
MPLAGKDSHRKPISNVNKQTHHDLVMKASTEAAGNGNAAHVATIK